jgi:mRNA interferase YafQ
MMLELVTTGQFRKDYKRVKKRGYDISLLEEVIDLLLNNQPLDERYKDHGLVGNYEGFRECHILSDWLLIYAVDKEQLILTASRTGTHSDLFTKF